MGAIERTEERLQLHADLHYEVVARTITVQPSTANGFAVALTEGSGEWIVAFDGWHEHFEFEDEALRCFGFGLSDLCRLRIDYRGAAPYRWTLQAKTDGIWREDSTTGLLWFPFWRRWRVEYRQNDVVWHG
jgi:hypothetical protein